MKTKVYNQKGKRIGEVELDDLLFGSEVNKKVLSQYVYSYLSNQRQSPAHTKTRAEVSGGGRKPWRQKGTGRARHGSSRSPIWKGGGVTFGPKNDRNWKKKITKSMKKSAIRSAFSYLQISGDFAVVDELKIDLRKTNFTRQGEEIRQSFDNPKKLTIVTKEKKGDLINAFKNIPNSRVMIITEINPYDLLTAGKVLVEREALEYANEKWGESKE